MIERFKVLMENLKLSPSEFADRIGVQRSSVSHVLNGRNKPSLDFMEKILIAFPLTDVSWLITGKSSPQNNPVDRYKSIVKENVTGSANTESPDVNKTAPAPVTAEPVQYIVMVFKSGSFKILKPLEE